jgi:hypothetical protein
MFGGPKVGSGGGVTVCGEFRRQMNLADIREKIGRRLANAILRVSGSSTLYSAPGHFYSPIVNPREAINYATRIKAVDQKEADRPKVDQAILDRTFQQLSAHFRKISDFLGVGESARYSNSTSYFNLGDAYIYSAFICELKPKLIVEVGCGFSSACALDTTEHEGIDTKFVFIEPYPDRLYKLLSPADCARSRILEMAVQNVGFDVFAELDAGDILFLDTTHVCKTGSDVNHELFQILPRLKTGVVVHFHDIFDNWEYPLEWIGEQNRSWNEIYALRAFLMFNHEFEIIYFNDFMWRHFRQEIEQTPLGPVLHTVNEAGSGLYLRKK